MTFYTLPKLTYSYDGLEPYIDAKTMEIHYLKHHAAYVDKLNIALEKVPNFTTKPIEELLQEVGSLPSDIRQAVINHGGGHANHSFFWQIMTLPGEAQLRDELALAIEKEFDNFTDFQNQFNQKAVNHFGSGWAWLSLDQNQKLIIHSTANQNSPIISGLKPIIGLDLWEHAYYLKYQNRRAEYIENWWSVVNWNQANKNFKNGYH